MQTKEMLQYLKFLKEASRKKADALEKLVGVAYDILEDTELDAVAFSDAIMAVDDKAGDMSNFADDVESLLDDYEELLCENAECVNQLVDEFFFSEDFKRFCGDKNTYL